jgi:DNA polymerase-1
VSSPSGYAEDRDLHILTVWSLTGRMDVSKDDRKVAKVVNFRLLYGMGVQGFRSYALSSYGIEMSLQQAALYLKRFIQI